MLISFSLVLTVSMVSSTDTAAARAKLKTIVNTLELWSPTAIDQWATQGDDAVAVTFTGTPYYGDISFRVTQHGIWEKTDTLQSIVSADIMYTEPICAMPKPNRDSVRSLAEIAFKDEAQRSYAINTTWENSDTRVRVDAPHNLENFMKLWELLTGGIDVVPMSPAQYGFVARVVVGDEEGPFVANVGDYRRFGLHHSDDNVAGTRVLYLIEAAHSDFIGLSNTVNSSDALFTHAYVQVLRRKSDKQSYDLFIVPAIPDQREKRLGGGEILKETCRKANSSAACVNWDKTYGEVFPELIRAKEIPHSATFDDIVGVLDSFVESSTEVQVSLFGAAFSTRKETLLFIIGVVIVIQIYLLTSIRMAVQVTDSVYGENPPSVVPWIALFSAGLPSWIWRMSLATPVVSIGVAVVRSLIEPQILMKSRGIFVTFIFLLASIGVAICTWRSTRRLRGGAD